MLHINIEGYDHANGAGGMWKLSIGGYNAASGPAWTSGSAWVSGNTTPFTNGEIRLGHDGTSNCILLGNTSTAWRNTQVAVTRVLASYTNYGSGWDSGWSVTWITSETGLTKLVTVVPAGALISGSSSSGLYTYNDVISYYNASHPVTGAVKFTFPVTMSGINSMVNLHITGFDYAGGQVGKTEWSAHVSFHLNTTFIAPSVWTEGFTPFSSVRLAFDGTKACLLLGTTATVWSYPAIVIDKVVVSYTNADKWATGWGSALVTSEAGYTSIVNVPIISNLNLTPDQRYFYDDYNAVGHLNTLIETAKTDTIRYQPISTVEYYNGTAWVAWTGGDTVLTLMLDGRSDGGAVIDH
jgi:hypothetical protein